MPPPGRPNPYNRRTNDPFAHIRRNQRIKAPEVRVIGPDGRQYGVMAVEKALQISTALGLDLVEVAATAQPPVCRILDFGKYKYEESKKQSHVKATGSRIKEVKLRPNIDPHDLLTKLRHAEAFLHHGNKVKLTLQFRGREMAYTEVGFVTMKRAIAELAQIGTADNEARLTGRTIIVMMTPLPVNKRKLKLNTSAEPVMPPDEEEEEDEEEEDDEDAGAEKDGQRAGGERA